MEARQRAAADRHDSDESEHFGNHAETHNGHQAAVRLTRHQAKEIMEARRRAAADRHDSDESGPFDNDAETHNGHQAAVRLTRHQAKEIMEARRRAAADLHDSDESDAMLPEQFHPSLGGSRQSRRVKSQEPSSSFQVNTEGDAGLASEWQEAYDKQQSESRLRRSRRTHAQPSSQPAKSEEAAAAAAAGPSQPAAGVSPVSTRETRAQNRSLRGQQADSAETDIEAQHRLLRGHQVHVRDALSEPAAAAAAGPAEGHNHAVRRSSRAHVRAAPANVDVAVDKADGATQGSTGIRVTLRPSVGSARQIDEGNVAPTYEVDNGRRSGLRVSLRPRRN